MTDSDFDDYYARHRAFSHRTALNITHDVDDAHDVVQSVFCKIWELGDAMEQIGYRKTWIAIATRNAAFDLVRRRARDRAARFDLDRPDDAESAEVEGIRNIDSTQLWSALGRLPYGRRELVEESFVNRWSHARIADRHHIALGTVKTRIRSGLHQMRIFLETS